MRVSGAVAAVLLGTVSLAGRADTLTTFTVNGTAGLSAAHDHSFDGTLTVDTTVGIITGVNIALHADNDPGGSPYLFTVIRPGSESSYDDYGQIEGVDLRSADDQSDFSLRLSVYPPDPLMGPPYLVDYQGGPICEILSCNDLSESSYFYLSNDDFLYVDGGSVGAPTSTVTATPEPSSALLLGSGALLTLAFAARRRLV